VRVFEVDQGVTAVRLQTPIAVGVLAFVAGEHDLLVLVRRDLAIAFLLGRCIAFLTSVRLG